MSEIEHMSSDEKAAVNLDEVAPDEALSADLEEHRLVPVWLAALVLLLLLAVMGVGGYVLRDVLGEDEGDATPIELEILRGEQIVAESPENPNAHLDLGFSYQQDGRYEDALVQYDLVLKYRPQDTAARYNSGVVLLELGRDGEAEDILWDVLEIESDHVLAAKALGELYASREQYRSLLVAVEPVVETHETAADLHYLMGLGYEHTGHEDWAIERYRLALTYFPDMDEAKEGLSRLGATP